MNLSLLKKSTRIIVLIIFVFTSSSYSKTTYTWNGNVSSDWNTATNWTPNGIPTLQDTVTINSTATTPALSANTTVKALTINSSTLTLNGNTFSATASAAFNNSVITTGSLQVNGDWVDFGNTVFNAAVTASCEDIFLRGSTFNQPINLTKTGTMDDFNSGGNTFNADVELTVTSTGSWFLDYNVNDFYNGNIIVNHLGANFSGLVFGFGSGYATLAPGKTITIGSQGFDSGFLQLGKFIQQGNTPQQFALTGTSGIWLEGGTVFNGVVNLAAPRIFLYGSTFNASCSFTGTATLTIRNGSEFNGSLNVTASDISLSGGTFNGTSKFTKTGDGNLGNEGGNTFNSPVEFVLAGSYVWGLTLFKNDFFNDNIILNCTNPSAIISFGYIATGYLAAGKTISVGSQGCIGRVYFYNFQQLGNTAQTLNLTGGVGFYNPSVFNGDLTVTAGQIELNGGTFNAPVILNRTIGGRRGDDGGNTFNASVEFNNLCASPWVLTQGSPDVFNGNVVLNAPDPNGPVYFGYRADVFFKQNVTFNHTGQLSIFNAHFEGTAIQQINGNNITIDKAFINNSQNIQLNTDLSIGNNLTLTNGTVKTNGHTLIIGDGATISGTSATNFIDGAIKKIGNTVFTFPIGKGNNYQPLSISAPTNTTDAFTAEYVHAAQTLGSTIDTSISNLSTCEYWNLYRTAGTSNVNVTLGWNAITSCNVAANDSNMRVAYFDTNAQTWKGLGGTNPTGNQTTGTITSINSSTNYGAYALAQKGNQCIITASTGASSTICNGGNSTLSASGGTTFNWTPLTGLSDGTISNPVANPSTTTTYTVTTSTSASCSRTATVTVNVNPLPTVSATATSNTVCAGAAVTLSASGAQSYSWTSGVNNNVAFTPVAVSSSGVENYTVTGTAANGCTNTASATITVNPIPVVTANTTATAICSGSNITLSGSGAQNYQWTNGVTNGVAFTPVSSSGAENYTVTGTAANGCTNTATILITVNPTPVVIANTTAIDICNGTTITLTGSGAQSYQWANGITNGQTFAPASSTTYTVTGTDANNCVGSSSITVTVHPLPIAQVGAGSTICSGASIGLTASGGTNYLWSPAMTLDNNIIATPIAAPIATTTYTVSVSNGYCSATNSVTITVNPIPAVSIAVTPPITISPGGNPNTIYTGYGIQNLTLTATVPANAQSYSWSPAAGLSCTNCLAPVAHPSVTTTYSLTVTDVNGCVKVLTITIYVITLGNLCSGC